MKHLRTTWRALAGAVPLLFIVGLAPAGAKQSPTPCVAPSGVDLNTRYDVDEAVVTAFCPDVDKGESWRPSRRWFTALDHTTVPAGYIPSGATPIEDFNRKFDGARYVVDAGTGNERTFVFGPEILRTRFVESGFPFSAWLPLFGPLPKGTHTVDIYVRMSADHWDGFGLDPDANSLLAGETYYGQESFQVG